VIRTVQNQLTQQNLVWKYLRSRLSFCRQGSAARRGDCGFLAQSQQFSSLKFFFAQAPLRSYRDTGPVTKVPSLWCPSSGFQLRPRLCRCWRSCSFQFWRDEAPRTTDRKPVLSVFPFWMVFLICVNVTVYVRNCAWHNTPFTADFTLHYIRFSAAWWAKQQYTAILPFSEFSNKGLDFVFIKLLLTDRLVFDWVELVKTATLVSSRGHKFPQILSFEHFSSQNTRTYRNLSGYHKVWLLLRCENWVFGFASVAITISWVRIIIFKITGWLASEMTRLWFEPKSYKCKLILLTRAFASYLLEPIFRYIYLL
jgi:hypothetical protein